MVELKKVMELEYLETGSYTRLNNKGWVGTGAYPGCEGRGYTGTYADQVVAICNGIKPHAHKGTYMMMIAVDTSYGYSIAEDYSIMVVLPSNRISCMSSRGNIAIDVPFTSAGYLEPGCYRNL